MASEPGVMDRKRLMEEAIYAPIFQRKYGVLGRGFPMLARKISMVVQGKKTLAKENELNERL